MVKETFNLLPINIKLNLQTLCDNINDTIDLNDVINILQLNVENLNYILNTEEINGLMLIILNEKGNKKKITPITILEKVNKTTLYKIKNFIDLHQQSNK